MKPRVLREHFVYWILDGEGDYLYVGHTRCPERRWQKHKSQKPDMYHRANSCRMAGPYEYEAAHRIEAHLIHAHRPKFNKNGRGYVYCPCGCEDGAE